MIEFVPIAWHYAAAVAGQQKAQHLPGNSVMKYQVRQLGIGGILDQTISLIKDKFGLLFGIVALTIVPMQFIIGLIQLQAIGSMTVGRNGAMRGDPTLLMVAGLLGIVGGLVLYPLTNAAIIHAVGSTYLSRPVTIGECFRHGLRRWGAVVATMLLTGLAVLGGLILLVIPAIIFSLWFSLAQNVAVLENASGGTAMGRSKQLMKGNMGSMIVLLFLLGVINFAISLGAQFIPQPHIALVATSIVQGIVAVIGACALVVFYFSARCKHENFDLELLAAAVDQD